MGERDVWWLALIEGAERAETTWSGGDPPEPVPVLYRIIERLEEAPMPGDAPKAAEVLADMAGELEVFGYGRGVAALLAYAPAGVAILPDGTLWALRKYADTGAYYLRPAEAPDA